MQIRELKKLLEHIPNDYSIAVSDLYIEQDLYIDELNVDHNKKEVILVNTDNKL